MCERTAARLGSAREGGEERRADDETESSWRAAPAARDDDFNARVPPTLLQLFMMGPDDVPYEYRKSYL